MILKTILTPFFLIYRVPLSTQLYFSLSSFKSANNLKFVSNYYLNDPIYFLCYQSQVLIHARILASASNCIFPCFICTGSSFFFQNYAHIKILKYRPMSARALKCLNLLSNARNHFRFLAPVNRSFLWHQPHLTTLSTSLQMLPICFTLCKQANLIHAC